MSDGDAVTNYPSKQCMLAIAIAIASYLVKRLAFRW